MYVNHTSIYLAIRLSVSLPPQFYPFIYGRFADPIVCHIAQPHLFTHLQDFTIDTIFTTRTYFTYETLAMVSAFHQPLLLRALDDDEDDTTFTTLYAKKYPRFTNTLPSDADETEDEEVKMNCIGGIPPDSDYYTSSEDEDDESITSESNRYVTFFCERK